RRERDGSSLAAAAHAGRSAADAAGRAFLDQRVPLAAGIALAGPARMRRTAVLADELNAGLSHGYLIRDAAFLRAPLWLASHLPHEGGDRPAARLSPIGDVAEGTVRARLPISPLVGEMSGRT